LCSGWLAISLPQYHQLHAGLQTSLGRYGTPFSGLFTCCSSQCKERAAWASRRNLNQLLHTLHAPHSERRERTCTPGSPAGSAVACHACKNNNSYDTSRCNDTYITRADSTPLIDRCSYLHSLHCQLSIYSHDREYSTGICTLLGIRLSV
jgi:hypothetical protein